MIIDLRSETAEFRSWIERKLAFSSKPAKRSSETIGGIVALFCYVQGGWIAVDFNSDAEFVFDGDVSGAAWDDLFQRPNWRAFAEADGTTVLTFIEKDGSGQSTLAAEATDEFLAGHFARMMADVLVSAWRDGVFSRLPLRRACVFRVDDFYGNWSWEAKEVSGQLVTMSDGPA
jgi:hypothetical protein